MPRKSTVSDDNLVPKPIFPAHVELLHQSILRAPNLKQARVVLSALTQLAPKKERLHARFLSDRTCARWMIDIYSDLNAEVFLSHPEETLILSLSPEAVDEAIKRGLVDPEQTFDPHETKQLRYGQALNKGFAITEPYTLLGALCVSHAYGSFSTWKKIFKLHDWSLAARTQGAAFLLLQGTHECVNEGMRLVMDGVDPFNPLLAVDPQRSTYVRNPEIVAAPLSRGIAAVADRNLFESFIDYCWKNAQEPQQRAKLLSWVCQGSTTTNARTISLKVAQSLAHRARTSQGSLAASPLLSVVRTALQEGSEDQHGAAWSEVLTKLGQAKIEGKLGTKEAAELVYYMGAYRSPIEGDMFDRSRKLANAPRFVTSLQEKTKKNHKWIQQVLLGTFVQQLFDEGGKAILQRFLDTAQKINASPHQRDALLQELQLALAVQERGATLPKARL